MAKKKRKTRKEKEMLKTHNFSQNKATIPVLTVSESKDAKEKNENRPKKVKSNVPNYVIKDLKKVTIITGLIVVIVIIIWILAFHTNILDPLFHRLNVKY